MKLVIAICHQEDAGPLVDELIAKKYPVTRLESEGGFLKEKNATILVGTDKTSDVFKIIKKNCQSRTEYLTPNPPTTEPGETFLPEPVEVKVGGATVFVLEVEEFKQL